MATPAGIAPHPPSSSADPLGTDDAGLVALAKRDRAAFAPLYARYVDPVYRYCLRRLGDAHAAEDATSTTFTKALAALPAYRDDNASFRSWLFAIAHNTLADTGRGHRPTADLDAARTLPDPADGPEDQAVAAEDQRHVTSLLAAVAPDQRQVLELRLAGLSGVEIARVLGRSPGAVRATQFRAVARLRTLLGVKPTSRGGHDV